LQASLLLALNLFSMLILFPAMMALDVRRLFAARFDIFCCFGRDSSATDAAILHNANNEKVSALTATAAPLMRPFFTTPTMKRSALFSQAALAAIAAPLLRPFFTTPTMKRSALLSHAAFFTTAASQTRPFSILQPQIFFKNLVFHLIPARFWLCHWSVYFKQHRE
jgi:hypothetical protein